MLNYMPLNGVCTRPWFSPQYYKEILLQCLIVLLGKTPTVKSEWILLWFSVTVNVNA